ncbi:MAG TPA: hypothetical protein VFR24_27605 [Candidatus Angelobacter sp.]|nr:hypothetical protein [Candidatus Angelobacter sp.]
MTQSTPGFASFDYMALVMDWAADNLSNEEFIAKAAQLGQKDDAEATVIKFQKWERDYQPGQVIH